MKNSVPRAFGLLFMVSLVGLSCSGLRTKLADIDDTLQEAKRMLSTLKPEGATYPEETWLKEVFIQVIGYADSVEPSGRLQASLKSFSCLSDSDFTINEINGRLLNKELSCRRAKSIKRYLNQNLWDNFPHNDSKLELVAIKYEGRGEQFPYIFRGKNHKPYQQRDERRRICKLYANVFVE